MRAVTIDSDLATLFTFTPRKPPIQWVAGIKKTGCRGTPPFLSLSTALIHPTPWFLSSGRGTQARAPARRIFREIA